MGGARATALVLALTPIFEISNSPIPVIARSVATKQSIYPLAMNLRRDGLLRSARNDGILRPAHLSPSSFRDAPLGAGPESILTIVVMDSGLALRAPRNDDGGMWHTHLRIHATQYARVLQSSFAPQEIRGRREDRVHAAPAVSCATCTKKRTRAYRFSGGIPAFPAQWFYGLLRALPGDRAFLPPSSLRSVCFSKNLTPASGRQNHTTSPYANAPFVCALARAQHLRVHRIPPYVRDDHDTPLLVRRDGQACSDDLPDGERGIFLERGAGQGKSR